MSVQITRYTVSGVFVKITRFTVSDVPVQITKIFRQFVRSLLTKSPMFYSES